MTLQRLLAFDRGVNVYALACRPAPKGGGFTSGAIQAVRRATIYERSRLIPGRARPATARRAQPNEGAAKQEGAGDGGSR